jgi:hypothetical protein
MLGMLQTNRLSFEDVPAIDFGKMTIKAVVDVVPQDQWASVKKKFKEDI